MRGVASGVDSTSSPKGGQKFGGVGVEVIAPPPSPRFKSGATPCVLSWCVYTCCTYIPPYTVPPGHLSTPTGLPLDLSEILILSSYISVTRLSFLVLYFPRLHSPRLRTSSLFVRVRVPQFLSVSLDLFCYRHVTLLHTFWCIPRIMTRLVTLLRFDLSGLGYKDSCSDHSLFRLGLLCEIQDLKNLH